MGRRVIEWMEACLVHTEGEWRGKPFRLMDWEKRLLVELFELEHDPDSRPLPGQPPAFRHGLRRRYRNAFICIPKKNGKTELAAAIALYLLIGDGEPSPKGVFAAGSLRQARLSYGSAQTMLLESPILRQVVSERNVGDLVIEIPSVPGSRLERVASESGTNDGPSLHFGVLDEIHEWPGAEGVKVHGVITNAGAGRKNPLFVSISTVGVDGDDDEQVWVQLYKRGLSAQRDPASDPTFYFYLRQAPEGADWQDRVVWQAANPSANETVTWSFYQSEWPKGEAWCRRYYLNQPPGRAEDAWMDMDAWTACAGTVSFDTRQPVYAAVRIAPDHRAAAIGIAQRQGERVALRVDTFEAVEDEYVDASELETRLRSLRRSYPAHVLAAKRYSAGGREHLVPMRGPEIGYHGSFFESSAQRLRADDLVLLALSESGKVGAAEVLKDLALSGRLLHAGDEELERQVAAVVAKPVAGGARIQRPTGAHRPIVAAEAAMYAVQRALTAPRPPSRTLVRGRR